MFLKLRIYLCVLITTILFAKKLGNINKLTKMECYSHHVNVRCYSYVLTHPLDSLTSMFILWYKTVA